MGCDSYDVLKRELDAERLRRYQAEDLTFKFQRALIDIAEDFGSKASNLALTALDMTRREIEELVNADPEAYQMVDLTEKK